MKKTRISLLTLVLTLALLLGAAVPALAAEVMRSTQALEVGGRSVTCEMYNIDGSNYFKLRDLAALLSGTPAQFSLAYDREARAILVKRGEAYDLQPGDLSLEEDRSATAVPSSQSVWIDGRETAVSAWNLGGNNYFRLRELAGLLGFGVEYDEERRTVLVSSETQETQGARLGETPDAGREYLDKIIFLGDSTTYGIGYYYRHGYTELVPPAQVWTPTNGTMTLSYYATTKLYYPPTGEELLITEAAERSQPEILVITLGVNGISFMDEDWFVRDYRNLVTSILEVSPDTRIILNSIYPVADSYQYQGSINNEKIGAANGWIEALAEELGVRFLYSFEALAEDGKLPESSQNGDGLHLTGESFGKVMAYIRTHALPGEY